MTLLTRISLHNDERSARLAGIALMLLSVFMFSFGDALGKFIVATYSVGQLLWFRACAALAVLVPIIWRHRAEFFRLERPWLQLLRVVLSTLEVAAFDDHRIRGTMVVTGKHPAARLDVEFDLARSR